MSTEPSTDIQPAGPGTKRGPRRAEPITKRTAKNGAVTWEFRADLGTKPDGSRDRRRFTYRTQAEARRELRRITHEVAAGTYTRRSSITVDEACELWLAGRRGIRAVTRKGYGDDLKPVRRYLGAKKLQQLSKADGDHLVEWMLTEGRRDTRHYRPESLSAQVAEFVGAHPEGVSAAAITAAFPGADIHTCVSGLLRARRLTRPRRAVYAPVRATGPLSCTTAPSRGVGPVTVRSTLARFGAVVQSFVDQGVLARNVITLVERPANPASEHAAAPGAKSWSVAEVEQFRVAVRGERLYACWLLSCYGLRRSEVLGLRWSDLHGDVLCVQRGRVAVGNQSVEGPPKSPRSRRNLPMPPELIEALRALRIWQKAEALELGVPWSDDRLIAVHEDATPVRHEWYSREFDRLRQRAGLRRIHLKGLRDTSVSLMQVCGVPIHIVAAWHGHDPAISLSVYSHAQPEDLRTAGTSLFG